MGLSFLVYYILAGNVVEEGCGVGHAFPDLVVGAVAVEVDFHGEAVFGEPDKGVFVGFLVLFIYHHDFLLAIIGSKFDGAASGAVAVHDGM